MLRCAAVSGCSLVLAVQDIWCSEASLPMFGGGRDSEGKRWEALCNHCFEEVQGRISYKVGPPGLWGFNLDKRLMLWMWSALKQPEKRCIEVGE